MEADPIPRTELTPPRRVRRVHVTTARKHRADDHHGLLDQDDANAGCSQCRSPETNGTRRGPRASQNELFLDNRVLQTPMV